MFIYTGVLGNFRRVGEVGVFSCSDSVKMKHITYVTERKLHLSRTIGHNKYNGRVEKASYRKVSHSFKLYSNTFPSWHLA